MTAFEAVLFDCDGVLVDSESITNRVLCTMLNESGWPISTEECLREFIGKLELPEEPKARLLAMTPRSYIGLAADLARDLKR